MENFTWIRKNCMEILKSSGIVEENVAILLENFGGRKEVIANAKIAFAEVGEYPLNKKSLPMGLTNAKKKKNELSDKEILGVKAVVSVDNALSRLAGKAGKDKKEKKAVIDVILGLLPQVEKKEDLKKLENAILQMMK